MSKNTTIERVLNSIIPRPKTLKPGSGTFVLAPGVPVIALGGEEARQEAQAFIRRLKRQHGLDLALADSPGKARSKIVFEQLERSADRKEQSHGTEAYRLDLSKGGVRLRGHSGRGLYYAALTFEQLLLPLDGGLAAPACMISDWPEFPWRGLLVAPGQGFMPMAEMMKNVIDMAARSKLNTIHLHLTDNILFTPKLDAYPQLAGQGAIPGETQRDFYTKRDIKTMVAYAAERKIDIMPAVEFPGHAMSILRQFPDLRCQPSQGEVSMTTMCLGAEASYEFIGRVIDEVAPLFPSPHFHIGTDEVEFLDIPEAKCFFNWDTCPVCRARMKREGLTDVRGLFYYFVRRTREMLAKHGKTTVMWNDQIDSSQPAGVDVPRDVVMQFWRVAAPGRGPSKGCAYDKLVKLGFPIVNSFFPETYFDLYVKEDRLAVWNPLAVPPLPAPVHRGQVLGSTMCAWEHLDIYPRVLPSAIPFFADRVWNLHPIDDLQAFGRKLAWHIFGPAMPPELERIYEALGGLILPLNNEKFNLAHVGKSFPGLTDPERMRHYAVLLKAIDQALAQKLARDPAALREYRKCLKWLAGELRLLSQGIGNA